ncbi:NUDIX domain-containing protein [Bacillus sp. JJ664]
MLFNVLLGIEELNKQEVNIKYREAVRAVIIQDHKILLIHSNLGDYKFPGGGLEKNESHTDGLLREVAEETGYINCTVKERMGLVIERHIDEYDDNFYFEMTSHYYLFELNNSNKVAQQLDDYEAAQEFVPKWLTIDEAIEKNQNVLNQSEKNRWIHRENFVLKELKKFIK